MKKIISIILILIIPFYILLSSVELTTFKLNSYEKVIEDKNIEGETGKNKEELKYIFNDLIEYLKGEDVDLSRNFNQREVMHMEDVEHLFDIGFKLKKATFLIGFIFIVYLIFDRSNIYIYIDNIFKGLFIWWIGIGSFFILALSDFTKYFTIFHEILFDNDLWLLDPTTDLMIQMLPESFFVAMFAKIIILFLLGLLILHLLIYFIRKRGETK